MDSDVTVLTRSSEYTAGNGAAPCRDRVEPCAVAPVLVAVDMSADSRAALLWACEYAANTRVPMAALHVLHDPAEAPGKYSRKAPNPLTPMIDTAESMLSGFMADARADHPELKHLAEAETKVVNGLPARVIVDEAKRLNAALIVVGSRGHSGLPRLVHGSVAQRVIQLSTVPVTVVKSRG